MTEPDQQPWPPGSDALVAAPASHRLLLEQAGLRVLEVVVRAGVREPWHTHRHRSVMIVDGPARIRYHDADGRATDIVPADAAKAELMDPEPWHAVENVDDHDYHAFRIEFVD